LPPSAAITERDELRDRNLALPSDLLDHPPRGCPYHKPKKS